MPEVRDPAASRNGVSTWTVESDATWCLTDVRMDNDDDGLELVRPVKAKWPLMPVVLYTGFGTVHDAVLSTKLGAADYLERPLEPDVIVGTESSINVSTMAGLRMGCLPCRVLGYACDVGSRVGLDGLDGTCRTRR